MAFTQTKYSEHFIPICLPFGESKYISDGAETSKE